MSTSNNFVMEEREDESMVSPTGGTNSHFRKAHFLTPTVSTAINCAVAEAPPPPPPPHCPTVFKDLPFRVIFRGWRHPTKKWGTWVHKMHSLHHKTWKKAGIINAILSSVYIIHRKDDLIFGFSEKWCPMTNSFVFPWGEATVTLEDMMILGGYSVLGNSILSPVPEHSATKEEIVEKLLIARLKLNRSKAKKADQSAWMNTFMSSGSDIEHEAFLAYWLSRFVFPIETKDTIGINVLPIAVHLARGVKIALAPAVLSCIYGSLTLLKSVITAARKIGTVKGKEGVLEITISAPLALVQVWIWERFPSLRPQPNSVRESTVPRMARWHSLKKVVVEVKDVLLVENFEWRPYMKNDNNVLTRKIYKDNEYLVLVDSDTDLDEELEGLVRCVRTSELVGLEPDCIQQYLPHRVAMQFGMDQDIPCNIARINEDSKIAWDNYNRPIIDEQLCVPSRRFEAGVTTRYLKWWKDSVERELEEDDDLIPISKLFRDRRNAKFVSQEVANGADAGSCGKIGLKSSEMIFIKSNSSPNPGFAPKSKRKRTVEDSGDSKPFEDSKSKKLFVGQKRIGKVREKSPLLSSSCSFKSSEKLSCIGSSDYARPVSPPPGFAPLHNCPVKVSGNEDNVNSRDGDVKAGGVVEANHLPTNEEFWEEFEQRVCNLEKELFSLLKERN